MPCQRRSQAERSFEEIAKTGHIQGTSGTYNTLGEWYAAEGQGYFADFKDWQRVDPVHRAATAYLIMRGVVQGRGTAPNKTLSPLSNLARAQAVAMILRTKAVTESFEE